MSPTYSVIVPTRRRPDLVLQAVRSVRRQTHADLEVIVVIDEADDAEACGDETRAALATEEVVVLRTPGVGVATARNRGVAAATGTWLCFLDDDDLWHPDRLAVTDAYLRAEPDCRAFQAGYWTFASGPADGVDLIADDLDDCLRAARAREGGPPGQLSDQSYLHVRGRSYELMLERNRGVISTSTVHRDVFAAAGGFPDGLTCAEDWLMSLRVARLVEWHAVPDRLAFVRRHRGNNTTSNPTNDVVTLQMLVDLWAAGGATAPRPLAAYGRDYRYRVREGFRSGLAARRPDLAWQSLRLGRRLLPSPVDRAYAFVPSWLLDLARAVAR